MMNMTMLPTVNELVQNVESAEKQTYGPDRYVVGSIKQLIYSNARFEEATKNTEKIMIFLTAAQVFLAIITLLTELRK